MLGYIVVLAVISVVVLFFALMTLGFFLTITSRRFSGMRRGLQDFTREWEQVRFVLASWEEVTP